MLGIHRVYAYNKTRRRLALDYLKNAIILMSIYFHLKIFFYHSIDDTKIFIFFFAIQ